MYCRWERECAGGHQLESDDTDTEPDHKSAAKLRELAGQGSDDLPVPEEVRQAQEELINLATEKERTQRLKSTVSKELENAKNKAAKIEEVSVMFNVG